MLILDSPSSDPRFNIAAEEYLLKETDREYAFSISTTLRSSSGNIRMHGLRSTCRGPGRTVSRLSGGSRAEVPYGMIPAT
jgi:hypothetical protein